MVINNIKYLDYNYESSKPYKTLPQNQTVRVYDKVPIQALSQERLEIELYMVIM